MKCSQKGCKPLGNKSAYFKYIVILLSGIILVIFVLGKIRADFKKCMGISFITEEEIQQIAFSRQELDNIVTLENHLLPYDQNKREIYIPCNVTAKTKFYELEGQLQSILPGYELYFVWDGFFDALSEAIKYGCRFGLLAVDSQGNFATYGVVFTTLPVFEMHGDVIGIDEREREVNYGKVTVWNPNYQDSGKLSIQDSAVEWHVRGFSSQSAPKKSLKLNLKDKQGEQNNCSFLGFDSDDDYLLNAMWCDDIKIREKLVMDLWNQMAELENSSLKMTKGEYCELIINEEYQGLRLLQNKMERSYLKLGEDDILLKGNNVNVGTQKPPQEVYEVEYSKQNETVTYQTIGEFFYQSDFSNVDLESWVDLQLFLHFGNMVDNEGYKNIFYVVERSNGQETLRFIPWDTDMSFGIYFNDGFKYDPGVVENISYRTEYLKILETYPEIETMLSARWKELRETIFTEENIFSRIDEYTARVTDSGALKRDFDYLGWNTWGGEDTIDNFKLFIQERLGILDKLYQ